MLDLSEVEILDALRIMRETGRDAGEGSRLNRDAIIQAMDRLSEIIDRARARIIRIQMEEWAAHVKQARPAPPQV